MSEYSQVYSPVIAVLLSSNLCRWRSDPTLPRRYTVRRVRLVWQGRHAVSRRDDEADVDAIASSFLLVNITASAPTSDRDWRRRVDTQSLSADRSWRQDAIPICPAAETRDVTRGTVTVDMTRCRLHNDSVHAIPDTAIAFVVQTVLNTDCSIYAVISQC